MKKYSLLCAIIPFLITGCSSSSDSTSTPTATQGAATLLSMQSKMSDLGGLLPGESTVSSLPAGIAPRGAIGVDWATTISMPNPQDSGDCSTTPGNVSLKDWMGVEFNEDATRCNGSAVNVFGRVKQATMVLCALLMNSSASTSADLPSSGTGTIDFNATFISNLQTICGMPAEDASNLSGATGTVTYSVPSPSTTFDRKMSLNISAGSQSINDIVYVKFTSAGSGAIATTENNSNGTSRTLVAYDSTTKIMKAEYISHSSAGQFYLHRLYKDETLSQAQVYSFISDAGNTSMVEYTVAGNPSADTDVAYAVGVTGYGFGSPIAGEACIDPTTGDISTDNSTTCGSFSSAAVSTISGGEDTQTTVHGASSTWNDFATVPAMSWSNMTDMLTSDL